MLGPGATSPVIPDVIGDPMHLSARRYGRRVLHDTSVNTLPFPKVSAANGSPIKSGMTPVFGARLSVRQLFPITVSPDKRSDDPGPRHFQIAGGMPRHFDRPRCGWHANPSIPKLFATTH